MATEGKANKRLYYINYENGLTRVGQVWPESSAMHGYEVREGYTEVTRSEWLAWREGNPESIQWLVYLHGAERKRVEALAKSAGIRPQDMCARIIRTWLKQH